MKVALTPHQEKFIAMKLKAGSHLSPAEIIREALRVYELEDQRRYERFTLSQASGPAGGR